MTKTILILAIAAVFITGATVIGFISDYDAEAAPKKPKPGPIEPILKPINATLAQLEKYENQLVVIKFSMTGTTEGIATSPSFNNLEVAALTDALDQISAEAEAIRVLADNTVIPD